MRALSTTEARRSYVLQCCPFGLVGERRRAGEALRGFAHSPLDLADSEALYRSHLHIHWGTRDADDPGSKEGRRTL